MSASGKAKLKKKSLSSPTYNATDTTSIRNVFCAVKAKRKYKEKPQTDSELGMISFFVEVEKQQYFDHLQLREALLKLLPFPTCLLLFEKQNSKRIRKVYIIFLAETDPNKCSVRAMFERAQKEVLADKIKLYYRYINLFSPLLYVETMKESLVGYECIRLENASDVEKKKLCEISQYLASFSTNSKNAVMPDVTVSSSRS